MKYAYVAEGFLNHNTSTSRMSSNNPNAQNFPRKTENPNDFHYNYGPKKLFTSRFGDGEGIIMQLDYCLAGDTEVKVAGGVSMPIKEIVARVQQGEEISVYSTNPETFETVVSRVERGALTFKNVPTQRLHLSNGKTVTATPEHRFIMFDGSEKELKDISIGEEIRTFYGYSEDAESTQARRLEILRVRDAVFNDKMKYTQDAWAAHSTDKTPDFYDCLEELMFSGAAQPVKVTGMDSQESQDVYCIKVEHFSNFALEAGVYSRNSQLELRVMSIFSQDENMQQAYVEGKDLHTMVASRVAGIPESEVTGDQRSAAKAVA